MKIFTSDIGPKSRNRLAVTILQTFLLGNDPDGDFEANGIFCSYTAGSLSRLQATLGVQCTGVLDSPTYDAVKDKRGVDFRELDTDDCANPESSVDGNPGFPFFELSGDQNPTARPGVQTPVLTTG